MPDNITTQTAALATPPASEVFAFDEVLINGVPVKVGRNKLGFGTDGNYTEVSEPTPFPVKEQRAATATLASVASSATSVTLLAANANRLGATIYNDSTQILYLKLGATASVTSHTLQMAAGSYYELPFAYTGIIDGIWASANGNARITELSA